MTTLAVTTAKTHPKHPHQITCNCNAYTFPHRLGSGKCSNASIEGPFCESCKCTCNPKLVDNGIGMYEYWGSKEVDVQLDVESDCCGAPVYKDQELTELVTPQNFYDDPY